MTRGFIFRASRVWWTISISALGTAVILLTGVLNTPTPSVLVLAHSPTTVITASASVKPRAIARSCPTRITIPSLHVSTSVGALGIQANGEVAVPTTVHSVGWYDRGPAPGQFGSAVILGHVDSASKGIGTFYYLKNMKPNAAINVTLNDGLVAHFAVTKVVQYSKTAFPDRLVYGSSGTESLQLVTCGGSFDYSTGHYLANIVVFSHLVSVTGHLKK